MKQHKIAKIVLIEDNPADILLLRHALNAVGEPYELQIQGDGAQALQFVRDYRKASGEDGPCVLILDMRLPKHDGLTVLRAITPSSELSHVHVIALTGHTNPAEELQLRELRVRLYRSKPHNLNEFLQLGQEIFEICKEHVFRATA